MPDKDLFVSLSEFRPEQLAEALRTGLPVAVVVIFVTVIGATVLWQALGNHLFGKK